MTCFIYNEAYSFNRRRFSTLCLNNSNLTLDPLFAAPSRILEHLYIGSEGNATNIRLLREMGITHIINTVESYCKTGPSTTHFLLFPVNYPQCNPFDLFLVNEPFFNLFVIFLDDLRF